MDVRPPQGRGSTRGQPAELTEQNGGKNVNAADLLGIADQVDSLEPGKTADLIAAEGDPLSDVLS